MIFSVGIVDINDNMETLKLGPFTLQCHFCKFHFYALVILFIGMYCIPFGNTMYLFVKIATHVLGPDHIVTSLEHLGTVPGVQA